MALQQRSAVSFDRDADDFIALSYVVHDGLILRVLDLSEDCMSIIQMGRRHMRDEKLGTVGTRAGVGHAHCGAVQD